MGQTCTIEIAFPQAENLSFGLQASEGCAMYDSRSIALILAIFASAVEAAIRVALML